MPPAVRRRPSAAALFAFAPLVAAALFFVLPQMAAFAPAFAPGNGLPARIWQISAWSCVQAALSALCALVLALPAAYLASSPAFRAKTLFQAFASIPFALPPLLMALGFVLFWGNAGMVNRAAAALTGSSAPVFNVLYRPGALVFCHAAYNLPLILRLSSDAFARARSAFAPAAFALGASPLRFFTTVALPVSLPAIAAAALLVFLYSLTSFSIALLIGGPRGGTLAVEIYRFARVSLDFRLAGILSMIETALAALAFMLYLTLERKSRAAFPPDAALRLPLAACLAKPSHTLLPLLMIPLAVTLGPVLMLIADSFITQENRAAPAVFFLAHYINGGARLLTALGRSLLLAALSSAFACALAFLAAEAALEVNSRRKNRPLAGIVRWAAAAPAASSGITTGFGMILLYGTGTARSVWIAAAAHAVLALPFAYNAISSALARIPRRLFDAAAVSGAYPSRRIWSVDLPLCAAGLRSAWAFAACISMGDLNMLLMLGMGRWETLPLYIYRAAAAYRFGAASAAGTVLILCCLSIFLLSGESGFRRGKRQTSW